MTAAVLDEARFDDLVARHRRELHLHCYRMLASFDDADDAVQETLLRAWRGREAFEGGPLARAWLYRIATNVCLDQLRVRRRQAVDARTYADLPWLQPYPDTLLDEVAPHAEGPEGEVVGRETVALAFVAAMQVLPPRQRAAFVLRDVMGWPAAETAALLETSVAAANSALQRARVTLQQYLPDRRSEWASPRLAEQEREVLARFIDAHERCDAAAAVALAAQDLRVTMPPLPVVLQGIDVIGPLLDRAMAEGEWRLRPTAVNRMPAAASWLRAPGDTVFRAFKLDVLDVVDGRVAEITTFGFQSFPDLGLPAVLDGG